jgi:hypothetical protein
VTEVADGFYVTPIAEPTEQELKQVIACAGSLRRPQSPAEEQAVQEVIAEHRGNRRSRR